MSSSGVLVIAVPVAGIVLYMWVEKKSFTGGMAEVDTHFIENIEQKLAERTSLDVFMEQLQDGSVDFVRQCIASLEGQLLSLGEKIFHAREVNAPQSLKYSVFLQWQNDMKSLLGEYEKTLERLQRLFSDPAVLINNALYGVRVETVSTISRGSVTLPISAKGTLTGWVRVVPNAEVSFDALRALAYDCARICEVLANDAISKATEDSLLAQHLVVQVNWDEPNTPEIFNLPIYMPVLKILK